MEKTKNKIVLNIPHSSLNGIFDKNIGQWPCNSYFMNECINKWTDWFTDFLFMQLSKEENVDTIVFPFSRFVCDVERLKNDPLEIEGNGIIYTQFNGYKRGFLSEAQKNIIMSLWEKHQENLSNAIENENTILIDCHSFPNELYDCDICIGHNDDWSYDKKIVDGVVEIFKKRGYKVEVNKPYSNSITPPKEFHYKSIMIEVNKRIYMNEKTLSLTNDSLKWTRWAGTLKMIHEFLS